MLNWSYPNQYIRQSQYYELDRNDHHHSSLSRWGCNSPESYGQPPYQQPSSYTPYQDQLIEEKKSKLEKTLEAFLESGR